MRVLPHLLLSRRAYASLVATSIPAFPAPLHAARGFLGGAGLRELGTVLPRRRQSGSINLNNEEPSPGFEN